MTSYEPEFLRFGYSLFVAFATILIAWHGIRMMLSQDGLGDHLFGFAKLLLFISFGYALIAFYESPIPGIGVSFSNLITDQTHNFANILDARSLELTFDHLDELWNRFVQPDAWSILANLPVLGVADSRHAREGVSLAVVAFGLIASAVCALVGPIFVPFFIVPEARFPVLVVAEGVHSVPVYPVVVLRIPDGVRALCFPVSDDIAAGNHGGPVHDLRPASLRDDRGVRRRHLARPLADEFDLLWTGWSERSP